MSSTDPRWIDWENRRKFESLCQQLLSAIASTAGLERIFSTFGVVQSKLRNRLGNEKAHKLVYMFRSMNQSSKLSKSNNLNWVWEQNEGIVENENLDFSELESEWEPEDDIPIRDLIPVIDLCSNEDK